MSEDNKTSEDEYTWGEMFLGKSRSKLKRLRKKNEEKRKKKKEQDAKIQQGG